MNAKLLTGMVTLLTATNVYANPFKVRRYEPAKFQSQGGAGDITANVLHPVVAALHPKRRMKQFQFYTGFDARIPPQDLGGVIDAQKILRKDIIPYVENVDLSIDKRIDALLWFNENYLPVQADIQARYDVLNIQVGNKRIGTFGIGVYGEFDATVKSNQQESLQPDRISIGDWEDPLNSTSFVYDDERILMQVEARSDVGGTFGFARRILTNKMDVAVGIGINVYHRWRIHEGKISVSGEVDSEDDILFDNLDVLEGNGATLSSLLLLQSHTWAKPTIGIVLENMGATNYTTGTEAELPRIGLGFSMNPTKRWGVAVDLENFQEGVPGLQMGTSYTIGNEYNMSFHAGGYSFQSDLLLDRTTGATAGLEIRLKMFGVAAGYSYDTNQSHILSTNGFVSF